MDLQVAIIGIAIFVISGAVLAFISVFGIKEKSYEEALAEQRQQTNALLGHHTKSKPKDNKKQKKAGKKVKEKHAKEAAEKETTEDSENTESTSPETTTPEHHSHQHHVEFKEPSVIVAEPIKEPKEAPIISTQLNKKRNKKEKVRPILINKEKPTEVVLPLDGGGGEIEVPPSNHFEQLHPKDEFELKHLHIKEDSPKQEAPKEPSKEQPAKGNKGKHENKREKEKVNKQQVPAPEAPAPAPAPVAENPETEVVPAPVVVPQQQQAAAVGTVKEKKKKKSELNTLQQLAGDKEGMVNLQTLSTLVRKAELSRSEVQILIDLLLNKQHEAPAVLDEWTEGKADPVQKLKKQLAEKEKALADEQEALVGAQAKLREVRAEQAAERSQLQQRIRGLEETFQAKMMEINALNTRLHSQNQKISQMQTQLEAEALKMRQLRDEHGVMQMKSQQLEIKLSKTQEVELTIIQLEKENHELQEVRTQLNNEVLALREQLNISKSNHDMALSQVAHFKKELEQKDEYICKREEQLGETELHLSEARAKEQELVAENARFSQMCRQTLDDYRALQEQKEEADNVVAQLKASIQKLEDEKAELEQAKLNGSIEETKAHQIELLNLHNELSSVKMQLHSEVDNATEFANTVSKLTSELEKQKSKNNELRQKNWKVMEALNAAESRNKAASSAPKNSTINLEEEILKAQKQEQEIHRKFIQRLFPDAKVSENLAQEQWHTNIERAIQNHVNSLQQQSKSQEIPKLHAEIQRYKDVLEESESILRNLEAQVEREELNWRAKLEERETDLKQKSQTVEQRDLPASPSDAQGVKFAFQCIERTFPAIIDEMQSQLQDLRQQLKEEQELRKQVECQVKNQQSTMVVEQLSEQINRLQEQLAIEQKKNAEKSQEAFTNSVKAQNHNTTNGTTLTAEQMLTTSSSAASSLTEVALKPKNKKKKKKNANKQ